VLIRSLSLLLSSGVAFAASAPTFPVLTYSTYLRDSFTPKAIATDPAGNIYLAGTAIVDPGTSQTTALVVKLNPQASQYLYIHYLGGSFYDQANAIAVDSAGNAYVAGFTNSPDFPVTPGGGLGTPPAAPQFSSRSFVTKLDPNGEVVFSDVLGGSATSFGEAVAVTPAGQILVSGAVSNTPVPAGTTPAPFPGTPGAYKTPNTVGAYLLELDPTGARMIFSALGVGGSAIVLDSAGNIYVAGSTIQLDYPTTPGAYQTTFPKVSNCGSPDCAFPFPGTNQYVTKVDPTGSKLIYSTAVTGPRNTDNGGLAVDQTGNAYLTGFAGTGYPYTVSVPSLQVEQAPAYQELPFLSKLDAAGQTLLFSVPVGGEGVQLDSTGGVYVGGEVGTIGTIVGVPGGTPALASVPSQCLPSSGPSPVGPASAYVAEVDAGSGNLLGSKFIGGSTLRLSGATLVGSTLWIAGSASVPDFPFTPSALTLASFGPGSRPGAYLGAVDFSQPQPPAGTPQIGCIVDAANLAAAGPVARNQLLTIFGTGLGPVTAVSAPDSSTTKLGGVNVSFTPISSSLVPPQPMAAPLLYASSTQINLAVPMLAFSTSFAAVQLTVNGLSSPPTQLPLENASPSLFPVVLNADGSVNSSSHGAPLGSTVSMFVNGLSGLSPEFPQESNIPLQLSASEGWSVTKIVSATPFVVRVDLQVPSSLTSKLVYCMPTPGQTSCVASLQTSLYYFDTESGLVANFNGQGVEEPVYVVVPE
jgi:uncharacterized protein (TIGR03437 family)